MLNLSFKTEYIIGAVVIVAFLTACLVREYGHTKQVERMQERIDALTTQAEIQQAQIAESDARLKTKEAELLAVSRLCTAIEETGEELIQTKEAVHETIQTDEASAAWADEPVPDSILDALHDLLCGTKADNRDKN